MLNNARSLCVLLHLPQIMIQMFPRKAHGLRARKVLLVPAQKIGNRVAQFVESLGGDFDAGLGDGLDRSIDHLYWWPVHHVCFAVLGRGCWGGVGWFAMRQKYIAARLIDNPLSGGPGRRCAQSCPTHSLQWRKSWIWMNSNSYAGFI